MAQIRYKWCWRIGAALVAIGVLFLLGSQQSYTRIALPRSDGYPFIAWAEEGQIHVAISNPTDQMLVRDVVFGTYELGVIKMKQQQVELPPHSVVVMVSEVVHDGKGLQRRTGDTVFLYDGDELVGTSYVQNLHPTVSYFRTDSYLVRAGDEVELYVDLPRAANNEEITLTFIKQYEIKGQIGQYTITPIQEKLRVMEDDSDLNLSYGWQGVTISTITPKFSGVGILQPKIRKRSVTDNGERYGGLTPPQILVIGDDMALIGDALAVQ